MPSGEEKCPTPVVSWPWPQGNCQPMIPVSHALDLRKAVPLGAHGVIYGDGGCRRLFLATKDLLRPSIASEERGLPIFGMALFGGVNVDGMAWPEEPTIDGAKNVDWTRVTMAQMGFRWHWQRETASSGSREEVIRHLGELVSGHKLNRLNWMGCVSRKPIIQDSGRDVDGLDDRVLEGNGFFMQSNEFNN
uniref:COesterase domain-containing protein n=2 Tax=Panagrellus redivivus TaxID=6233 RepID=A0A7E4UYG3_PANRE